MTRLYDTREEALWDRVEKGPDCWNWTGPANTNNGYGQTTFCGERGLSHRVAWELTRGPIPDGLKVLHRCDNPKCCRPDHLFLGTMADNCRDRDRKGRFTTLRGSLNGHTHLSEDDVRVMRSVYPARSYKQLGEEFGVDQSTVALIVKRKTWKHVA